MTNDYLKRTRNQIRNLYAVETKPEYLADVFPVYNRDERAKILNDMDAGAESFDGDNPRESADNFSLRMRLEATHQALIKAGR